MIIGDILQFSAQGAGPEPPAPEIAMGGFFTAIGGDTAYTKLVLLDPDGVPLGISPPVTPTVVACSLKVGNYLYFGGTFSSVDGNARTNLACIDLTTGAVQPWAPTTNARVFALATNGTDIFIGGEFTNINGTTRRTLGAVDANPASATPTLRAWNPNPVGGSQCFSIAVDGDDVYVGGNIWSFNGGVSARNYLAAFTSDTSIASPTPKTWNPNMLGGWPNSMVVDGGTLYCGGNFTLVNGVGRNRLVALQRDTTVASPTVYAWNPNADGEVLSVCINGADAIVGGYFANLSGSARAGVGAVASDVSTNTLRAWDPQLTFGGTLIVYAIVADAQGIYIGGDFTTSLGESRTYAAGYSADTSTTVLFSTWNPTPNTSVWSMTKI